MENPVVCLSCLADAAYLARCGITARSRFAIRVGFEPAGHRVAARILRTVWAATVALLAVVDNPVAAGAEVGDLKKGKLTIGIATHYSNSAHKYREF